MTLTSQDGKKKSFIRNMFARRERNDREMNKGTFYIPEAESDPRLKSLVFTGTGHPMSLSQDVQTFRVFVATWNVGGKSPNSDLNLDDILHADQSDIYILGFQEIVPLNAGNVLVIEDNEPAAKWLALINQSLNKSSELASRGLKPTSSLGSSLFFSKYSLKKISKTFRTESGRRLKTCNCNLELERKQSKDLCFRCQQSHISEDEFSSEEDDDVPNGIDIAGISFPSSTNQMNYSLVAIKQMVGIFVTVWARKELVQHIGHLRISCISRGIMGCLGNKGCISVSMSFHQTSFCFVCSHLASGEKEGDELRRNMDVIEILKNTQFPNICRSVHSRVPEKILEHDRIIWLGDLNYRIALSYSDARKLLEENAWDALLDKDQLKIEREAGRVFKGWKEGKIYFAPTYKYSSNSDTYAGETKKSKKKRRTPAWCDRILWHGTGIRLLSYIRGESKFSDHRPVCATFLVDVDVVSGGLKKGLSGSNMKVRIEELLPPTRNLFIE
ncbi:type I inositol polyphosphate 5-phosphatase 10-like isoform X1 [Juglans microcarpa x Juglans regia]|uniref:type I inositol polyphosphate 5-phosphatase 10-like isoform X1 n=1 Tax=Juglans microcarpa x Juglans regia TaxID=2249226 RepID=UPI001B7EE6A6|nr:type I inositol polyphosphate 5-phosphatase 10-like isoform X1 [Juglans microcarpa x Juglans regia]XP_040991659.1 type I inositol polyphosphate 5-phosphatase 10-like isoform X1 [Juglans microcarpa x Juglans regia]XP_040991660.1 type I inositol polyphosphate 5-phosphatase 10-like isoform X1 [Juglans microcarpa x Juglans regia]XP_040991661.1 type I inositol polyphosphate 5-phosphatase 10-like isoform X1 [Juglans microcarpa x Juglans regia]XP_040991662.1 type I inositol polyphosphate 5-phosphat